MKIQRCNEPLDSPGSIISSSTNPTMGIKSGIKSRGDNAYARAMAVTAFGNHPTSGSCVA